MNFKAGLARQNFGTGLQPPAVKSIDKIGMDHIYLGKFIRSPYVQTFIKYFSALGILMTGLVIASLVFCIEYGLKTK